MTEIFAHPLGFTRMPITLRNHIAKKLCIFLTGGGEMGTPLTPLVWLRHCFSVQAAFDHRQITIGIITGRACYAMPVRKHIPANIYYVSRGLDEVKIEEIT